VFLIGRLAGKSHHTDDHQIRRDIAERVNPVHNESLGMKHHTGKNFQSTENRIKNHSYDSDSCCFCALQAELFLSIRGWGAGVTHFEVPKRLPISIAGIYEGVTKRITVRSLCDLCTSVKAA